MQQRLTRGHRPYPTTSMHKRRLLYAALLTVTIGILRAAPGAAQPVAAPAAAFPMNVTGGPTPVSTLRLAIEAVVRGQFPDARDAQITLVSIEPPLAPVALSADTTVQATVQIATPPQPAETRIVPITFTNVVLPWSDAQVLLVSNSPETLPFGKVLYNGSLASGQTARLLYHHQNGSKSEHMEIAVNLSNPTALPVTLWVDGASAGPTPDELAIGHAAARSFLEQYWSHAGFLMQIPANTTIPLFVQDLPPLGVVSGVAQLSLVDGERLNLQVVARLASEMEPPTVSFESDFDTLHQRGAFALPQITRSLAFTAGGPPLVMTLGANDDLLRQGDSGTLLQGNYGVIYTFDVRVANPTAQPAVESLVMHADGGQARGTFLVDDKIIDGPVVQPNAPRVITTVRIGPQASRIVRIATMPESGSNYPVRLLLGPPP